MNAYSNRDFTGQDLTARTDMVGLVIDGSCFGQETYRAVFPLTMIGTTFRWCNLDNCVIPPGNEVEYCSRRRFCVQNDLEDWLCDRDGRPVEPLNRKLFEQLGLSCDPATLPRRRQEICATRKAEMDREAAKQTAIDKAIADFERQR